MRRNQASISPSPGPRNSSRCSCALARVCWTMSEGSSLPCKRASNCKRATSRRYSRQLSKDRGNFIGPRRSSPSSLKDTRQSPIDRWKARFFAFLFWSANLVSLDYSHDRDWPMRFPMPTRAVASTPERSPSRWYLVKMESAKLRNICRKRKSGGKIHGQRLFAGLKRVILPSCSDQLERCRYNSLTYSVIRLTSVRGQDATPCWSPTGPVPSSVERLWPPPYQVHGGPLRLRLICHRRRWRTSPR